jgi:hypothetical protein
VRRMRGMPCLPRGQRISELSLSRRIACAVSRTMPLARSTRYMRQASGLTSGYPPHVPLGHPGSSKKSPAKHGRPLAKNETRYESIVLTMSGQ